MLYQITQLFIMEDQDTFKFVGQLLLNQYKVVIGLTMPGTFARFSGMVSF